MQAIKGNKVIHYSKQSLQQTLLVVACMLFIAATAFAQTISGNLSQLANQEIKLHGFHGLNNYLIASGNIDSAGNFELNYAKSDIGVGYLISADNKPMFVILSGENMELKGEALSLPESMHITKGQENQWFEQYAQEHPRREQALSAWAYLEKIYMQDSLFAVQQTPSKAIQAEKQRIKKEDAAFLEQLPKDSYVRWYLPTRKLVSSVRTVAQYRTAEIPATIKAFRTLNHADNRLFKSGLLKDALEGHFWLIENSGLPLDSVAVEMQRSIDVLLEQLVVDEAKLNTITDFLFDLLERHSLFQASEYLAIKVLNETSCTLNSDLAKQLETYRAMKKGNKAANIEFNTPYSKVGPQSTSAQSLSDIESPYTLVVFGASWCTKCTEELPKIASKYAHWKAQGLEVVFVSLDTDQQALEAFSKNFPFTTLCDFKKWDSPIAQDYYVFGTPTLYLLNQNLEIELRPNSIEQVDAWVDWFLADKNNNESN